MAAAVPLPNNSIVNVQMFGSLNAQTIITLFQYQNINPSDPNDEYTVPLNKLYTELTAAGKLFDAYLDVMPSNYTLDFIRMQPVYPQRIRFIDSVRNDPGANAAAASTSNLAASIERFGVVGGRRAVGRIQLPIPDGKYTGGNITNGGYIGIMVDLITQMVAKPVTNTPSITWNPVIHNLANPQPLTVDVTGGILKESVRTMHRRTVGLGI